MFLTPNSISEVDTVCRSIIIPRDSMAIAALNGAIEMMTMSQNWERYGTVSPDEAAERFMKSFEDYLVSSC